MPDDSRTNLAHEWNQNIIRNLKHKFPKELGSDLINGALLIQRFYEWTAEFCFSEDDPDFLQYLLTGE
jgi:hypothetical protein